MRKLVVIFALILVAALVAGCAQKQEEKTETVKVVD